MKNFKKLAILILFVFIDCFLFGCVNRTQSEPKYTIEFHASIDGGYIEGRQIQIIEKGENSEKIVAIAYDGYYFEGWADLGVFNDDETITRSERIIENVSESRSYFAMFKKITYRGPKSNTFIYNYRYATSNLSDKEIKLIDGELDNTCLIVPSREHCVFGGWYADEDYTIPVANENGKIIIDSVQLFNLETNQFYAKWISQNEYTYKILFVYVTELNAELTKRDKSGVKQVNYQMTENEKKICHLITEKVSKHLNDLGIARFQVDEYFTTIPVTKESMREASDGNDLNNTMYAYNIPEVCELSDEYQSVLVSFSMNDYNYELHNGAGAGGAKYGYVNFDSKLNAAMVNGVPFEMLIDPHYYPYNDANERWYNVLWPGIIDTYLHELIHTIEQRIGTFEYHRVVGEYLMSGINHLSEDLYLVNQAVVDGKKVGIPYEFWEGKVARLYYEAGIEGVIRNSRPHIPRESKRYGEMWDGDAVQYVVYGYDAGEVTAIALSGYEFVCWSDGVMTATRKDTNISGDLYVKAIFRKKSI